MEKKYISIVVHFVLLHLLLPVIQNVTFAVESSETDTKT